MKARLNRWVLRECLNSAMLGARRMGRGRSFQREGAAAEKALSPQVRRLVLMVLRVFAPADLRQRVGAWRGRRSER